ncbi:hypothetical protein PHMEG_0006899 [Phytophthora megakarya]|uniref:Uncharacterized protein n=1 Tax=Phytophthora megakarya TaxID=4795 RepID=A0A225WMS0_9STRA|nr:hypothetical protein PHMEG_0006899 [Phytophthora megakarya]
MDMLFIAVSAEEWVLLTRTFNINAPTFQKKTYAQGNSGTAFRHFATARSTVDVTFQQTKIPGGAPEEQASNYSNKYKVHGLETEVSVLPCGLAINSSRKFKGSEADTTIFRVAATAKATTDDTMTDDGPLHQEKSY